MAYYTADLIRDEVSALSDDGKFPDAYLTSLIAEFESIAERYRGVAFESRTTAGTCVLETSGCNVHLNQSRVTAIGAVTAGGASVSSTDYTWYRTSGYIDLGSTYPPETVVTVGTITHGYTTTPDTIKHACREFVRSAALSEQNKTPRDVISQTAEGMTLRYSTPNWKEGRPTGWVSVDMLLNTIPDERRPRFGLPTVLR